MKLTFEVSDLFLLTSILNCKEANDFTLAATSDRRRKLIELHAYCSLTHPELYGLLTEEYFESDPNREITDPSVMDVFNHTIFQELRSEAQASLTECKLEWDNNEHTSFAAMQDMTGIDFNKDFKVLITHPAIKAGMYIGNNTITWTHRTDWSNYSTVYLWHEILHAYIEINQLNHAVIELITDHELRKVLSGIDYPPFIGHEELHQLEQSILPQWLEYLKKDNKNIFEFIESVGGNKE